MKPAEFRQSEARTEQFSAMAMQWLRDHKEEVANATLADVIDVEVDEEEDDKTAYEASDDESENFNEALSLLETARSTMVHAMKIMDNRGYALPGGLEVQYCQVINDINQFVKSFEPSFTTDEEETEATSKMIVMGPTNPKGTVSHNCAHTRHDKCILVACQCPCHKEKGMAPL